MTADAAFQTNEELKARLIEDVPKLKEAVATIIHFCYGMGHATGWWHDLETGEKKERNVGELLMLCVSELAEAMEGDRKNKMDDKLPQYEMFTVELADAIIRIADLAGGLGVPLADALADKFVYNATRDDHKPENRLADGGKKY